MIRRSCAVFVAVCLFAAPRPAHADPAADSLRAQGDAAYTRFDFTAAEIAYRASLARDSTSYEAWCGAAHAAVDRGQRAEYDGKRANAEPAYDDAIHAARKAVALKPGRAEGHAWLAAALGRKALFEGGKEKIRLSKSVKAQADSALAIDPRLDRAWHILGRWNRGIAELSFFEKSAAKVAYGGVPEGATMNNAVTCFEKAVAIRPDYANHHLELGRTYLKVGLTDKAKAEFERVATCPPGSPFDDEYRAEAKKLMDKVK